MFYFFKWVLWGGRWQIDAGATTGEEVEQINSHFSRLGNTTKHMLPEGVSTRSRFLLITLLTIFVKPNFPENKMMIAIVLDQVKVLLNRIFVPTF